MEKTTVCLTRELERALTRLARARRCSEAELRRGAVSRLTAEADVPVPRLPLFGATGPSIAGDVDQALAGFGSR